MPDKTNLITLAHPRSPAAEAYRALRTNLYFSNLERPLRTLVVTCPAPGESKSVVLANLAVVMAQAGQRVLLVDADLRRPSLHQIFSLDNSCGLSMLFEDKRATSTPPVLPTGVDNLQVLPTGPLPADPAARLASPQMDEILPALHKRADVVLFDAPPVLSAMDAAILGLKADGVLLVMEAGHTSTEHARQAKESLERARVRIVGVALNRAVADRSVGRYSYTARDTSMR